MKASRRRWSPKSLPRSSSGRAARRPRSAGSVGAMAKRRGRPDSRARAFSKRGGGPRGGAAPPRLAGEAEGLAVGVVAGLGGQGAEAHAEGARLAFAGGTAGLGVVAAAGEE